MKNETTTKANPVKPNTSSKLNIEHKGICQASEVVQAHYSGDSGSVSTNQKNLADEQNKHLACSQTAGNKPASTESTTMSIQIKHIGAVASNGNNKSNVVRKAFGGFSKPETLAEGDHAGVVTGIEEVAGTEDGEAVNRIEISVSVDNEGAKYALKRSYNMNENGRGAAQLVGDYNALFGTDYGRYELYKLECDKLVNLPVIVVVGHNNASKVPVPVIKEFKPMVQAAVGAEPAPLAA